MRCVRCSSSTDAKAVEVKPVAGHILLGLKHNDVNLGSKHAAEHHKATQAD